MKNYFSTLFLFASALLFVQISSTQKKYDVLTMPAKKEYTHIDVNGKSVLASGRYITPAGKTIQITHDPFGLAISPDGTKAITLHNGVFTIIDNATMSAARVPGYDDKIVSPFSNGSFLGVAFSADSKQFT